MPNKNWINDEMLKNPEMMKMAEKSGILDKIKNMSPEERTKMMEMA